MARRISNPLLLLITVWTLLSCSRIEDYHTDVSATLMDENGTTYLAHEVIFMPSAEATVEARESVYASMQATVISETSPVSTELGYIHLRLPGNLTANEAITLLLESGIAETVDKNYLMPMTQEPNDSRWSYLWGMNSVKGPEAWNLTTGSRDTIVAVVDTGVDYYHPDLADNMWSNTAEIPDNGVDDDANGFIDDVAGWHFDAVTGTAGNNPMDIHGHGTHVAGTIGAVGNNNTGVVGVSWQVSIMALNAFHNTANGPSSSLVDLVNAIKYAANNGARVVNASLGGYFRAPSLLTASIQSLRDRGGMFIAASGNDGVDTDVYDHNPSNVDLDNVVSVAALAYNTNSGQHELCDSRHGWSGGSNYGLTTVDIGGPGHNILSTMPSGAYGYMSGTSMASPHVAGVAGLFLSAYPEVTVPELRQALLNSVDDTGELAGKSVTGGRVNVFRMINEHIPPPTTPEDFTGVAGDQRNIQLSWTQPESETPAAQYLIQWGTSPGTYVDSLSTGNSQLETELLGLLHGATYYIVIQAVGDRGQLSATTSEISVLANDGTPPATIIDLVATSFEGAIQNGTVLNHSGEVSPYWAADNVADGDPTTAWFVAPTQQNTEHHIIIQLEALTQLEQIELLPSEIYPDFFPIDFDIEVSQDGVSYSAVGFGRSVVPHAGQWQFISFEPVPAQFVRLKIVQSFQHESGLYYAGLAEIRARGVSEEGARVRLRFTAPGDDPGRGHADHYRVYHATGRNGENLVSPSLLELTHSPLDSGLLEDFVTPELTPETTYHFQLSAVDSAGNVSGLSNIATASTRLMPPAPINDLAIQSTTPDSVLLVFSPTGQNGTVGLASSYDVRVSNSPITAANFYQAIQAVNPVTLTEAGQLTIGITPLVENSVYYFAVKGIDVHGLAGGMSNVVSAIPQSAVDTTPPSAIDDLVAWPVATFQSAALTLASASTTLDGLSGARNMLDGVATSDWRITGDNSACDEHVSFDLGASLPIDRVRLYRSVQAGAHQSFPVALTIEVSADHANWLTLVSAQPVVLPDTVFVEYPLPVTHARYVLIRVNQMPQTAPGSSHAYAAHISETEILVREPPSFDVDLTWIAPGDDGWFGTAHSYELYHASHAINADNFDANTVTTLTTPAPAPGGMIEVVSALDLGFETTHHFALKTKDEAANASALSNSVAVVAPALPPAPVMDLRIANPNEHLTKTSALLTLTATGDDGYLGNPASIEVRHHTQPITWENWSTAVPAFVLHDPSIPAGAHYLASLASSITPLSQIELPIANLAPSTDYHFAARVWDDAGNGSLLSNIAEAQTLDGIAPAGITDLLATFSDPTTAPPQTLTPGSASASVGTNYTPDRLVDNDANTDWMSDAVSPYFEMNLSNSLRLGKIRLLFSALYWDLAPSAVSVFARESQNDPWKLVAHEDAVEYAAGWQEWSVGSIASSMVRVEFTPCAGCNNIVSIAGFEAYEDPSDFTTIELRWTAPGDDENDEGGQAQSYDLRRDSGPLSNQSQFDNANHHYRDDPEFAQREPLPVGFLERFTASGLAEETEYCFALTATDDLGNTGSLSNSACAFTRGTPPSTVFDLQVVANSVSSESVTLSFSAPAVSENEIRAHAYEICYQEERITSTNWASCHLMVNPPEPLETGTQTVVVPGLAGATRYYFAIRSQDVGGNWSAVSNNARATTDDDIPPARIQDLLAIGSLDTPGQVALYWSTPADDQAAEALLAYDIRWRVGEPVSDSNWNSPLTSVLASPPAPAEPGSSETHVVVAAPRDTLVYFGIRASDNEGNWSQVSNSPQATTLEEDPQRVIDLSVVQGPEALSVTLGFTAPGANYSPGFVPVVDGVATTYDIRYSTEPIGTQAYFYNENRSLPFLPAVPITPLAPGNAETITVPGLESETRYYFAMVVIDEWGRTSYVSNSVNFTTPDVVAPAPVSALSVSPGAMAGALMLEWTAPADDGTDALSGKIHHYDIFAAPTAWNLPPTAATCTDPCASLTIATNISDPLQSDLFTMSGLTGELHYYVAMRACDETNNCSSYAYGDSMSAGYPPKTIDDLVVTEPNSPVANVATVTLAWSAPEDTGTGGVIQPANRYAFGYSLLPITSLSQFLDLGHTIVHTPTTTVTPASPGTPQSTQISGLQTGVTYYFAVVSYDEMDRSSNVAAVPYSTIDITAPNPVGTFSASTASGYGSVLLQWTPPGDDGNEGAISSLQLYSSVEPFTGESCVTGAVTCTTHSLSNAQATSSTVSNLAHEALTYFAIRACDEALNCSSFSYAQARTRDKAPSAMTLALVAASRTTTGFQIQFVAPGDDDDTGTPADYFIYVSASPIGAQDIGDANDTRVFSPPPAVAGATVVLSVTGLVSDETYYVAGFARDDRGNDAAISNTLEANTIDTVAPGLILDLSASSGSVAGVIELAWSATGDEGNTGTADKYFLRYTSSGLILTQSDWDNATLWTGATPVARPSGLSMTATLTGLNHEVPYYFAVRAQDEDGNMSGMGSSVLAYTPPIPPARTNTLTASALGVSVTLNWVAPGDDGNSGLAVAQYDIRRSTQPISEANFAAAQSVTVPADFSYENPGGNQTMTTVCPNESTLYYFALKAIDTFGAASPMSNTVSATTDDLTAPGAPSNLSVTSITGSTGTIAAQSITASSVLGPGWSANNAVDGSPTSPWASEGHAAPQVETLILDLGSSFMVDRIVLRPDGLFTELFPVDFSLLVSTDQVTWHSVATESGFAVTDDAAITWGFAPQSARYVQLVIYNTGSISTTDGNTLYYALLAEMEALHTAATQAEVQLTWMTPGDDGDTGTASYYEIYYGPTPFDSTSLSSATAISGAPTPLSAGSLQTLVVESLPGESTYYFAIRAVDEVGNVGTLSQVTPVTTLALAPTAIGDLSATASGSTSMELTFSPTYDDASSGEIASTYDIRYTQSVLTSNNFEAVEQVLSVPILENGFHHITVSNLSPGTLYRFAVKAFDESGNGSYVSNVALAQTETGPDMTAPDMITDFSVHLAEEGQEMVPPWTISATSEHLPDFGEDHLADGTANTGWATQPATTQDEHQVRIGLSEESYVDSIHLVPAPGLDNLFPRSFRVEYRGAGLGSNWQQIAEFDDYSHPSGVAPLVVPLSQPVLAVAVRLVITEYVLEDGLYYAVLGEFEIYRPQLESGNAFAIWTAPRDIGPTGQASSYAISSSECPWSLASAQFISGVVTSPRAAGYPERAELSLPQGTHCLGISSFDGESNESDVATYGPLIIP